MSSLVRGVTAARNCSALSLNPLDSGVSITTGVAPVSFVNDFPQIAGVAGYNVPPRIDFGDGPTPVLVRGGRVEDVSKIAPTVADLMNAYGPGAEIPRGEDKGPLEALLGY